MSDFLRAQSAYPRVQSSPIGMYYTIRINDVIGEPSDWVEEIATIENASQLDVVHFKINSSGGRLDTTLEFLSAMRNTPAKIICEITGHAASAATLIFLMADEYMVNNGVDMMVHSASFGAVGKAHDVVNQVGHINKQTLRLLKEAYSGFFTEDELEQIVHGREFWMEDEEILERLDKRAKFFEDLSEEEQCSPTDKKVKRIQTLVGAPVEYDDAGHCFAIKGELDVLSTLKDTIVWNDLYETRASTHLRNVAEALKIEYKNNISRSNLLNKIKNRLQEIIDIINE